MGVLQKIDLIDKVARELQSRFTYEDINVFLDQYGIARPTNITQNSKWLYSKAALAVVEIETIIAIAQELEIDVPRHHTNSSAPPKNWKGATKFRIFISHISKDKDKATRLKNCLELYAISGFVAHVDIYPTVPWQREIERALQTMDAFLAIHTVGFSKSFWTQQEIGFAFGRGSKIISLKMGEDPTGFISTEQALARAGRTAEEIAKEIDALLEADQQTAKKLLEARRSNGLVKNDYDEIPF